MVAKNGSDAYPATSSVSQRQNDIISTQRTKGATSATQEAHIDSMSLVRGYLKDKGLSTTATTVIEKAWRSGTRKQYATYLQKWKRHCTARGIDPFHPSVEAGINFLAVLFDSNIGYTVEPLLTATSLIRTVHLVPRNAHTFFVKITSIIRTTDTKSRPQRENSYKLNLFITDTPMMTVLIQYDFLFVVTYCSLFIR